MAPTNKLTQLIQPLFDHKAFSYIKTYITLSLVLICIGIGSAQSLSELDTTALKQMLVDAESEIDKIPILKRLVAKNAGVNNAAIAKYLEALKIIANQEKRYDVLGYVADKNATFAYFGGDLDQARSKFKESYDVYLKTDSFDLAYISKIKIGVMHSIQGNYNNAELIYREVDEEISSETHLKAAAFLHNNLGTLFHYQGIADSAHHYYNKAIQDYLELEDSINVLRPMQNQSLLWRGDKKAVNRLIEIADIRRALGNKADLMVTLNALSNVQVVNNNNYERSQKYAEEAYHLSKDVEGVHFKIKALVQLCSVSLFQEDYEQALKYIDEAKDLSLKSDLKEEIISVYLNYGRIYWNQKIQ